MVKVLYSKIKEILSAPTEELGRASRFLVFQLKLWPLCRKLLIKNRYGQQAAALSYHTLFGVIPLTIVILLIFQSFPSYKGLGADVKGFIYESLQLTHFEYPDPANPGEVIELTDYVDDLVAGFFEKSSKGSVTIASSVIVIWAAIGLLSTIERTFNNIWNVRQSRTLVARIFSYWTPLTLGPLLLGAGIYLTTNPVLRRYINTETVGFLRPLLPYAISVFAFFIFYWSIPNTRVKAAPALWGAAVAALIWMLVKMLFRVYITEFIPYSQIYGVLGLIPLTVLWIYITWKIVLFGVQLTYTTQNLEKLDAAQIAATHKEQTFYIANEQTILEIMAYICNSFENGNAPVEAYDICKTLNLPDRFTRSLLDRLVSCSLLLVTTDPKEGYVPAKSCEQIKVSEVFDAVASQNLCESRRVKQSPVQKIIDQAREQLGKHNLKELTNLQSAEPESKEQDSPIPFDGLQ